MNLRIRLAILLYGLIMVSLATVTAYFFMHIVMHLPVLYTLGMTALVIVAVIAGIVITTFLSTKRRK